MYSNENYNCMWLWQTMVLITKLEKKFDYAIAWEKMF